MNKLIENPAWNGTVNWDGMILFIVVLIWCLWLMEKLDE